MNYSASCQETRAHLQNEVAGGGARQEKVADSSLREAIERAERGLIDADLGGGLIKQRVARRGAGRSGGYRMIVAYREGDRAVFLLGFAKSERANITPRELEDLRFLSLRLLHLSEDALESELEEGYLQEVEADGE
jgi:hypothetical protein